MSPGRRPSSASCPARVRGRVERPPDLTSPPDAVPARTGDHGKPSPLSDGGKNPPAPVSTVTLSGGHAASAWAIGPRTRTSKTVVGSGTPARRCAPSMTAWPVHKAGRNTWRSSCSRRKGSSAPRSCRPGAPPGSTERSSCRCFPSKRGIFAGLAARRRRYLPAVRNPAVVKTWRARVTALPKAGLSPDPSITTCDAGPSRPGRPAMSERWIGCRTRWPCAGSPPVWTTGRWRPGPGR